jgi:hypothetical protein
MYDVLHHRRDKNSDGKVENETKPPGSVQRRVEAFIIRVRRRLKGNAPALLNQLLATTPSSARPSTRSLENNFILRDAAGGSLDVRRLACQLVQISTGDVGQMFIEELRGKKRFGCSCIDTNKAEKQGDGSLLAPVNTCDVALTALRFTYHSTYREHNVIGWKRWRSATDQAYDGTLPCLNKVVVRGGS